MSFVDSLWVAAYISRFQVGRYSWIYNILS